MRESAAAMTNRLGAMQAVASQDRLGGLPAEIFINGQEILTDLLPRAIASPLRQVTVEQRRHFFHATQAAIGDTAMAVREWRIGALVNGTLGIAGALSKDFIWDGITAKAGGSVIVRDAPQNAGRAARHSVQKALTTTDQAL